MNHFFVDSFVFSILIPICSCKKSSATSAYSSFDQLIPIYISLITIRFEKIFIWRRCKVWLCVIDILLKCKCVCLVGFRLDELRSYFCLFCGIIRKTNHDRKKCLQLQLIDNEFNWRIYLDFCVLTGSWFDKQCAERHWSCTQIMVRWMVRSSFKMRRILQAKFQLMLAIFDSINASAPAVW